ncbi:hypothetical protein [Amycolatopsis minnesotensis]|uniref:AbiJ N-terminal domain-containing protein n=1 Tax=Amycolatopsis minnesotensis TaxID=337894 RepID=A0ABN2SYI3_9PSEU
MTVEPLDEQTLMVLADLICGDDTLHYRTAAELADFFRRAGWDEMHTYDGETRRAWTIGHLLRRRDDAPAIEQVLCRLVDRREYPHHPDVIVDIQRSLNRLLEGEGIHVEIDTSLRPHVKPGRAEHTPEAWDDLSRSQLLYRIEDIVTDTNLVPLLNQRVQEIATCRRTGCHLAAVILAGSLLEGVLLDAAENRVIPDTVFDEPAAKEQRIRKPKDVSNWTLHALAYIAHRLSWIDSDVAEVIGALRKFRNLVHANQQRQIIGDVPDEDTLNMYWPIVVGAINDLGRTKPGAKIPRRGRSDRSAGPWAMPQRSP